ncbi:MAG: hypothetical protein ACON4U_07205 [Myxococcota bacterium]
MLTIALIVLGCSPTKAITADLASNNIQKDTAYVIFDTAVNTPTEIDIDAISDLLQSHVDQLRHFDTMPVLAEIAYILSEADETCPTYYTNDENPYWADQCTSTAGAEFQGYGTSVSYEEMLLEDGTISSGSHYYGEGYLVSSSGVQLEIEGGLASTDNIGEDGTYFHTRYLDGQVYNASSLDWTGWNYGPRFQLTGARNPESGHQFFFGAAELETETTAVFIDQLVMINDIYNLCTLEPGATINVFTESSGWLTIDFHGPTFETWETDMSLCDGCGQVSQLGSSLGEVCIDFSDLINWENNPWTE